MDSKKLDELLLKLETLAWEVLDVKAEAQKERLCQKLHEVKHQIRLCVDPTRETF